MVQEKYFVSPTVHIGFKQGIDLYSITQDGSPIR